jgi:hypothetical protein
MWWWDLLDVSIAVALDYNSSHIELLLDNESLTVVWIFPGPYSLQFSLSLSESRTELAVCGPNIEHPVGQFISSFIRSRYENVC